MEQCLNILAEQEYLSAMALERAQLWNNYGLAERK